MTQPEIDPPLTKLKLKNKHPEQPDLLTDNSKRIPHTIQIHPDNLNQIQPVLNLFDSYLLNLIIDDAPRCWQIQFIASNPNALLITDLLQHSPNNPDSLPWTGHLHDHPNF